MDNILSHIISFIAGLVGGSLITLQITKKVTASNGSKVIDQSGANAGGDIVGGNKQ